MPFRKAFRLSRAAPEAGTSRTQHFPLKLPAGSPAWEHVNMGGSICTSSSPPILSSPSHTSRVSQIDTSLTTRTSKAVTEGRVFRPLHTSRSSFHVRASLRLQPFWRAIDPPPALEACAAVSGALPAGSCSSWALQASRSHPGVGWNSSPARSLLIDSWVY